MGGKARGILSGKRIWIAVFLFFNMLINYMDRVNLSVAGPGIAHYFQWNPATMGWIFAAYLWTYTICLAPIGTIADRFGVRNVSAVAISLWSAATMVTGGVTGFSSMILARLGLGIGESTTFPVAAKVIRQWFPARERGIAGAIFHCGGHAAPAVALPLVAWLVVMAGWRLTFVILGALGFVWLFFWLMYYQQPEQCRWISEEERQLILATRDTGSAAVASARNSGRQVEFKSALGALLKQRSMWGVMLTQGCSTYFNYVFLAWLPTYLVEARGIHLVNAGFIGAVPYLVAVLAVLGFSRLSDWLLTPEGLNQGKRRNIVVALLLGCCVAVATNFVDSQFGLVVVLSLAMSFNLAALTLNLILTNDLLEDGYMIGTVQSMVSVMSNIFGMFAPVVTGYTVKATGSFAAAFYIQAAIVIVGAVISYTFTRKPIRGPEANRQAAAATAL
jgi:ACS family glucarate transporter-like MFS transporter